MSKLLKAKGNYAPALRHLERYVALQEQEKQNQNRLNARRLQQQYEEARKDNEIMRRELEITRQQAVIQKKNSQMYLWGIASTALVAVTIVYFRNRQRIQRQRFEIAAWKASQQGEEKERSRLARELHDNVGGTLSTVKMWFETIGQRRADWRDDKDYSEAMQLLDTALSDVRNTAHHLMPELLLRLGLAAAVRVFCENIGKASGMDVSYQYFGYIGKIEKNVELVIYRIIQELVQNVVKHAQASSMLVQLSQNDRHLTVTIEDNGIGIDPSGAPAQGVGLQNIRETIRRLGGQFNLQSSPQKGTVIDIDIDLQSDFFTKEEPAGGTTGRL